MRAEASARPDWRSGGAAEQRPGTSRRCRAGAARAGRPRAGAPSARPGTPRAGRRSRRGARRRRGRRATARTTSAVSATTGEQVAYATTPPGRTLSSAAASSARCSGTRSSRSAGVRRQRDSGRRRSAPESRARRVDEDPVEGAGAPRPAGCRRPTTTPVSPADGRRRSRAAPAPARCGWRSEASSPAPRSAASAASSADLPPGPAQTSSHRSSRPSTAAEASASATSCEPSSCTPARPSATAGIAPGSPPPSSTAYGDCDEAVPPAPTSSSTVDQPGPGHQGDPRGGVVGGQQRVEVAVRPPSASARASTTQRGWRVRDGGEAAAGPSGATSRTHSPSSRSDTRRSTALVKPAGALTHAGPDQVDGGADRGVRRHPHRQQLVGAQPQRVEHLGLDLRQRPVDAGGQHRVVRALPADRAADQLGGERRVAAGQPVLAQHVGQHQVRVGVLDPDRLEHVVRRGARRVDGRLAGGRPAARPSAADGVGRDGAQPSAPSRCSSRWARYAFDQPLGRLRRPRRR